MSLIENDGRTIGPEPAAPISPELPPEVQAPPEAAAEPAKEEAEPEEIFDRKYVEGLREEAAKYRTRARDYEQTFGEMPPELRDGWLELINVAQSGDPEAIQVLGQMLGFQGGQQPQEEQYQPDFVSREDAAAIARQEAYNVTQQYATQQNQVQAVNEVVSEAKQLGYDQGSPDYVNLLWFADQIDVQALPAGETLLGFADKQVKEHKQAEFQAFIAAKEEEARTSPAQPAQGVAPNIPRQAYDPNASTNDKWAQVRDSLHERLSNI